jgi:hypothetical protein
MNPYQFHYHIRWSRLTTLDYEAINTRAAAEASAEQSVLKGETYTLEEHDETCSRCEYVRRLKSLRGTAERGHPAAD